MKLAHTSRHQIKGTNHKDTYVSCLTRNNKWILSNKEAVGWTTN